MSSKAKPVKKTPSKNPPKEPVSRIDLKKALTLRIKNQLTYDAIGIQLGVAGPSVFEALKPWEQLIKNPQAIEAYRANKGDILTSAEMALVSLIPNKAKDKKSSLGNVAYAIDKLDHIVRLEEGKSTQNILYADIDRHSRELRRELEGLGVKVEDVIEGEITVSSEDKGE